jgi:hypothetical protein
VLFSLLQLSFPTIADLIRRVNIRTLQTSASESESDDKETATSYREFSWPQGEPMHAYDNIQLILWLNLSRRISFSRDHPA